MRFPRLTFARGAMAVLRRPRVRFAARVALLLGVAGGLFAVALPEIAVRAARARATACLRLAVEPRGPELPDCSPLVRDFDLPTDSWWTHHDATYRAEELLARVAVNRYVDAAVGDPDPDALVAGSNRAKKAQELVERGSRRVAMEELGPSMAAPHRGKLASSLGDRATLVDHADETGLWNVRVQVLEAAMMEADFEEVERIAERFAEWDPRDADLRTTVGAVLCLSDPRAGLALLERVPGDRADKRYANIQRNYGEVAAVLRACTRKVGGSPPKIPSGSSAGDLDAREVGITLALLQARSPDERSLAIEEAIIHLHASGDSGVDVNVPHARAALLAGVLGLERSITAAAALDLVALRAGEPPIAPKGLTVSRILGEPPGLLPKVPPAWLGAGALRLEGLAEASLVPADRARLRDAAAALHTLAGAEHAREGDAPNAVREAAEGARVAGLSPRAASLSMASAAYVGGDRAFALTLLEAPGPLEGADPGGSDAGVERARTALGALLYASTGDHERANAAAGLLGGSTDAGELGLEARWIALALGEPSTKAIAAPKEGVVWAGMANPRGPRNETAIDATFLAWEAALSGAAPAGAPERSHARRAFRYHLMDRRGDAPPFALPLVIAADRLLDADSASAAHEIWLDALLAIDLPRMRLRTYAWTRMEAARIRGDAEAAELWSERLAVLRKIASSEDDREIAGFLRF